MKQYYSPKEVYITYRDRIVSGINGDIAVEVCRPNIQFFAMDSLAKDHPDYNADLISVTVHKPTYVSFKLHKDNPHLRELFKLDPFDTESITVMNY